MTDPFPSPVLEGRSASAVGRRLVVLVAAAMLLSACEGSRSTSAPLPPAPPEVVVTMTDYSFGHPPSVPSGRVVFRVPNQGQVAHRLTLLPLADELPPFDVMIRDEEAQTFPPFAGIRPIVPGAVGAFAVDLVPGQRYVMVCLVRTQQGEPHALKGMSSEFRADGKAPVRPGGGPP